MHELPEHLDLVKISERKARDAGPDDRPLAPYDPKQDESRPPWMQQDESPLPYIQETEEDDDRPLTPLTKERIEAAADKMGQVTEANRRRYEMEREDDEHKLTCNSMIKFDLENAGFVVRWTSDDNLIVSLNRRVSVREVTTALDIAEYIESMYTAKQYGWQVVVDAVV